jgi:hypothetical protein
MQYVHIIVIVVIKWSELQSNTYFTPQTLVLVSLANVSTGELDEESSQL